MSEMDPFREFDEPRPENDITYLGDGSFLINMEGSPPVPWRTGFAHYEATQQRVRDCYSVYWQIDPQAGLDSLAEIIDRFREEHTAELEEAALAHDMEAGLVPVEGSRRVWPVEEELEVMQDLHRRWTTHMEKPDSASS